MKSTIYYFVSIYLSLVILASCSGRFGGNGSDSSLVDSTEMESVTVRKPQPGDSGYHFSGREEIEHYLKTSPDAKRFAGGILPVIAADAPEYADKLISQLASYSKFIVVDKAGMKVILYDKYGHVLKSYGMACAKNYGTKHAKADSRTPEGFFSVQGKYDSTEWLYTDDDGNTSQVKGQFGPRFIRLKIPNTSQIGIHGTGAPWSIGHRTSHGCIRITNENILELYELVEKGMPVIVLPGKRDRAVNRSEGYYIPFFPTEPEYAMSAEEKNAGIMPDSTSAGNECSGVANDSTTVARDSVNSAEQAQHAATLQKSEQPQPGEPTPTPPPAEE